MSDLMLPIDDTVAVFYFCQLDENQFQTMHCILHHTNSIVLANNERIVVPKSVRFIWEVRLILTDLLSSEYVVIVYLFMYYYVNVSVLLCGVAVWCLMYFWVITIICLFYFW